jgi:cell division protein FtsB
MDVLMELVMIVMIGLLLLRLIFPFVLVGYVLNDAMQASEQEYQEVAAILKKHPKLKPVVDQAMADRIITKAEFADLQKEVSRISVDEAIENAGNLNSN